MTALSENADLSEKNAEECWGWLSLEAVFIDSEGGNPRAARLRIGLGEPLVDAVVGGVTRYDQAN